MPETTRFRIYQADNSAHFSAAASLFRDYASELGVDLCFQNFEKELAELPGSYAKPLGTILLAHLIPTSGHDESDEQLISMQAVGCAAIRPAGDLRCELKRMYVHPNYRSLGIGKRLAEEAIRFASQAGYQSIVLDTLDRLQAAITLYQSLGFVRINAYYTNPLEGVVYMSLDLRSRDIAGIRE